MKQLLLLFNIIAFSQLQAQHIFNQIGIEQGLSQSTVNSIVKDNTGYMWFGTNDGLNRYDGYVVTTFRHQPEAKENSLSNNKIYALTTDLDGNLWAGTRFGLNLFKEEKQQFQVFLPDSTKGNTGGNFVRALLCDNENTLWAGTYGGGLFKMNNSLGQLEKVNFHDDLPEVTHVYDMALLEDKIILATNLNGLLVYQPKNRGYHFLPFVLNSAVNNQSKIGKVLFVDAEKNIWVGTEGKGLFYFDRNNDKHQSYTPQRIDAPHHNIVKDIISPQAGLIWVATDGGGIYEIDLTDFSINNINAEQAGKYGLLSNAVYHLYQDSKKIVWVGTFNEGILYKNPFQKAFNLFTSHHNSKGLSHKSVLSFTETEQGQILVGTDGGGLNIFDPTTNSFETLDMQTNKGLKSNVVTSMVKHANSGFWVGTYAGGLYHFNLQAKSFKRIEIAALSNWQNKNIWALENYKDSLLWIGTLDGLYTFNYSTEEVKPFVHPKIHAAARITSLKIDSQNRLWIGGSTLSVFNLNNGTLTKFSNKPNDNTSVGKGDVRGIFEDSQKNIWICTEENGISKFEESTKKFKRFTQKDGLVSNAAYQLLEDDSNRFWLSTNNGLSAIQFNIKREHIEHVQNYSTSDGLQSKQFAYSAALKSSSGKLYFGGIYGFNAFEPAYIKDNPNRPQLVLTNFKINEQVVTPQTEASPLNKHISKTNKIELNYEQSRLFSLEFTGISFTAPSKNKYAYILEGFQEDWVNIGNQRKATFTNLDQGTYRFKVKGANNDGLWGDEQQMLTIVIHPPLWKTTWAYALYILVFMVIILSFRKYSLDKLKLENDLKIKDLEREKIKEINRLKLNFFTNISHEFRTPLTLILYPLEKLLHHKMAENERQHSYNVMFKNANRLLQLINQLMDFRKIEEKRMELKVQETEVMEFTHHIKSAFDELAFSKKIDYQIQGDIPEFYAWIDHEKLDKILFNLLSNAFKFTGEGGRITIDVSYQCQEKPKNNTTKRHAENYFKISITDTGKGIDEKNFDAIFENYFSSQAEVANDKVMQESTGLGLSLCKELVQLHKGQISVEKAENKGTVFSILLPLDETMYKNEEKINANSSYQKRNNLINYLQLIHDEVEQKNSAGKNLTIDILTQKKETVLIVEDNLDMLELLAQEIGNTYHVVCAENGRKGFEMAKSIMPDLIVSDVMMPEVSGIELLQMVKENEVTNHVPVILLTAKASIKGKIEGLQYGADDYLPKPFHPTLLMSRISNLIETRKKLREKFGQGFPFESNKTLPSADDTFVKNCIEIIINNLANSQFNVDALATNIGMSRSVLYRKMRAVANISVNDFINQVRLKKAAELLLSTNSTIAEIAYETGFSDPQYFSKCFKKLYETSPTRYIKLNRKQWA